MRAVHSSAPCSPCMNCESSEFWISTETCRHSFSPKCFTGESSASCSAWKRIGAAAAELPADLLGIDVDRPVEVGRRVPLRGLGLLVELHERAAAALVVPGEDRVEVGGDRVDRVENVGHTRMLPTPPAPGSGPRPVRGRIVAAAVYQEGGPPCVSSQPSAWSSRSRSAWLRAAAAASPPAPATTPTTPTTAAPEPCGKAPIPAAAANFKPVVADTLSVVTSLPGPGFWEGSDTDPTKLTSGYEYDIAKCMEEAFGLSKMTVRNVSFDAIVAGTVTNYDLALSQVSITPERAKVVDVLDLLLRVAAGNPDAGRTRRSARSPTPSSSTGACRRAPPRSTCSTRSARRTGTRTSHSPTPTPHSRPSR